MTTLYLNILSTGLTLTASVATEALSSISMTTNYAFDSNVVAKVYVTDDKTASADTDPLNHLIFNIEFADKVDDSTIYQMQGRLFTGGGVDALTEAYSTNFGYIVKKLDFYSALDGDDDFFEEVTTTYNIAQKDAIVEALTNVAKVMNNLSSFRIKKQTLAVPVTKVTTTTDVKLKRLLIDMTDRPRYLSTCVIDDLTIIEALAEITVKVNGHLLIDVGELTDWNMATAFANTLNFNDHRILLFWSPNKSRATNATTVLARKKWRPVNGDYLGQLLLRNANSNSSGIAPVHVPIAGYDFPVGHRDLEKLPGVVLDEEAQNALADAKVNVVLNERFAGGSRWIYGDVLTQCDGTNSALRLVNSSEVATYLENNAVAIAKRHLLKAMTSYIQDTDDDIRNMLNACVAGGLLTKSSELGNYYAISVNPRQDNAFDKVDIKMAFRPVGCARQVHFTTTVTK